MWRLFKLLHLVGLVATWVESQAKAKAYAAVGNRGRSERHRRRRSEASAFLRKYLWRFMLL